MKRLGNTLYDIIDQFTGENLTFNKATKLVGGQDITDNDCDGIIYRKLGNEYFKRNYSFLKLENFGAVQDGRDNSVYVQKAIDFLSRSQGGDLNVTSGIWKVKEVNLKYGVRLNGENGAIFRFFPENPILDKNKWCIRWTGALSELNNISVDGVISAGVYAVGNGVFLTPDPNLGGLDRKCHNLLVEKFAGYKENPIGGTYGINKNFNRFDISDGFGNHLLEGGKGFIVDDTLYSSWNFEGSHINIKLCDGDGMDIGTMSDSNISDFHIYQCVNRGFVMGKANKNNQISKGKVALCRNLNPRANFNDNLQRIVPHELTLDADRDAAVIITGANNFVQIESQENGSSGFMLGTDKYCCYSNNLQLKADGNGGYDISVDDITKENYRRYGVISKNTYKNILTVNAGDFRANFGIVRQQRGYHAIGSKPTFTQIGQIVTKDWYRIANNSGGANFIPLQKFVSNPSNDVGTIFQARSEHNSPLDISTNFGTGYLEAVNDFNICTMTIIEQYEQDYNLGLGYSLTNEGVNSHFEINGTIVQSPLITGKKGLFELLDIKQLANIPTGLNLNGIGTDSARLFFSSQSDLSNSFCFRKSGNNLILSVGANPNSSSGTSKLLFLNTGDMQPSVNNGTALGSSVSKFSNVSAAKFTIPEETNGRTGRGALGSTGTAGVLTKTVTGANSNCFARTLRQITQAGTWNLTVSVLADFTVANQITITAYKADGTINTGDTSIYLYEVAN